MADGDHPRDELVEAAAAADCMSSLLAFLGTVATATSRRRMFSRLDREGIDRSHWRRSPRTIYSRDELAHAVALSTSVAGVLRILGRPQAGGTHSYLAGRIRQEGLDTSHFTGSAHNKGIKCPRLSPAEILVLLPPGFPRRKTEQLRRALRQEGVPERCDGCGQGPTWQGRPLTLVIEHHNGDWLDNRLANLRLLCPNCHAQTATWCRRKTGVVAQRQRQTF
jgi:hypothetical protein